MADPKDITPRTDAGADTLARFRYQAEVTFPFCLRCALEGDIISVIPEHLEDIALEYENRWRFLQVKSRNPERGPWRLSDLLADNGALRSLFRTHRQLKDVDVSLELVLEGAIKIGDPIQHLRRGQDHSDRKLIQNTSKSLKTDTDETTKFLNRIVLLPPPVPRPHIRAENIRLLHQQNRTLDFDTVEKIYTKVLQLIENAMRADALGSQWPLYVMHPQTTPSEIQLRVRAKRLTRDALKSSVAPIKSKGGFLLRRITGSDSENVSLLERKLVVGGATVEIIERARMLRANAQYRRFEIAARSLMFDEGIVDDLRERLETHCSAKKALHHADQRPAIHIWDDLLQQLTGSGREIDRHRLFGGDPMLLLGEICELSELCRVDWGVANAY